MAWDIQTYLTWFEDYVESYMHGAAEDRKYIQLKHDHTLRVLDNATSIADALQLCGEVRTITLLGALLHDVGRFEQFKQYHTFSDKGSVNHGYLGSRILKQVDVLDNEPQRIRQAVRATVALHNRYALPAHFQEYFLTPLRVVRDSDKLDIFPVLVANFTRDGSKSDVVSIGLEDDAMAYSSIMLENFHKQQPLHYSDLRYENDFKLLLASWIYSMNYPASVQLIQQRGVMDALLDTLPPLPEMEVVKQAVHAEIERVLA